MPTTLSTRVLAYLIAFLLLFAGMNFSPVYAKGHGGSGHGSHVSGSHNQVSAGTGHRGGRAATGVASDKHGRIARSQHAKTEFKKSHPCPATGKSTGACPGYVIDHVKPLKRGGADHPSNMQWQTKEAAKEKDKTK